MSPKYVERIARLPRVLEHLAAHPDGLLLRDLAAEFDVPAEQLREDLLAFYTADIGSDLLMGLSRPSVLEFLGPDGEEEDPNNAEVVQVSDPRHLDELGVEHVDAAELALIYTAGQSLLEVEPHNDDLVAALDALAAAMFGAPSQEPIDDEFVGASWRSALDPIVEAQRQRHRRVDIVYSRAWSAGVGERTIEPYRLVKTRRGWEVDAGPLDSEGKMRTFLLSNVRGARLRESGFEPPEDLPDLLEEQRRTRRVRVELPQSARWAADMYAERVAVVTDGESQVELDLDLLPPLRHRLGLLLLASGPGARVLEPEDLEGCDVELARELVDAWS